MYLRITFYDNLYLILVNFDAFLIRLFGALETHTHQGGNFL